MTLPLWSSHFLAHCSLLSAFSLSVIFIWAFKFTYYFTTAYHSVHLPLGWLLLAAPGISSSQVGRPLLSLVCVPCCFSLSNAALSLCGLAPWSTHCMFSPSRGYQSLSVQNGSLLPHCPDCATSPVAGSLPLFWVPAKGPSNQQLVIFLSFPCSLRLLLHQPSTLPRVSFLFLSLSNSQSFYRLPHCSYFLLPTSWLQTSTTCSFSAVLYQINQGHPQVWPI